MERYGLYRKDRQGIGGEGVALYVNDQLECMELHLGMEKKLPREAADPPSLELFKARLNGALSSLV